MSETTMEDLREAMRVRDIILADQRKRITELEEEVEQLGYEIIDLKERDESG